MKMTDLTLCMDLTHKASEETNEKKALLSGHLGTHFDVMDKTFDLSYLQLPCVAFDVSRIEGRDIEVSDIDFSQLNGARAVLFYSGFIEQHPYGSKEYFTEHPQLSPDLIDRLLERNIAIIGVDFAGVRRGQEHPTMDRHCADHGTFIVENLCNIASLLDGKQSVHCTLNTYPLNFKGWTGLPCRVVAMVYNKGK